MEPFTPTENLQIQESLTHPVKDQETQPTLKNPLFNNVKLQVPQPSIIHLLRGHIPTLITPQSSIVVTLTPISVIPILKTIKNVIILSE